MANPLPAQTPLVLLISGPAGSGKTTLCDALLEAYAETAKLKRVVTATTRPPREGEENEVDYYFLSENEFEQRVQDDAFFENAYVFQHRYGILKSEIHDKLARGVDILVNVDVQGAAAFREQAARDASLQGKLVTTFIMPPDREELRRRLIKRGQNDPGDMEHRLEVAATEMKEWVHYDYVIPSGSREEDFHAMLAIYRAEKLRVRQPG